MANMAIESINELGGLQNEQHEDEKRSSPWTRHMRIRGIITSIFIGIIFSVIVMKLNLTIGIAPNFNVSAAFLAFIFIRTWTKLIEKAGFLSSPFTPQENTIIQTCAVACYSIASGGQQVIHSSYYASSRVVDINRLLYFWYHLVVVHTFYFPCNVG